MAARQQTVAVWQDRVPMRVHVDGGGPAVVFFHGPFGLARSPFLEALAKDFTVYAPEHPGTTEGAPDTIHQVDNLWDLVLCYDELLDRLGLAEAALVGASFGGMVACEVAAHRPARVRRLVLIDPVGLWRDDAPVVNWMLKAPQDFPSLFFKNAQSPAAREMFAVPEDPEAGALARTRLTWAMGATGKFIWPIPDKGLKKRIHRISAPTLLVWGEDDRIVPPAYADEFARRLPQAKRAVVKGAGHAAHLEQPEEAVRVVRDFLASR